MMGHLGIIFCEKQVWLSKVNDIKKQPNLPSEDNKEKKKIKQKAFFQNTREYAATMLS